MGKEGRKEGVRQDADPICENGMEDSFPTKTQALAGLPTNRVCTKPRNASLFPYFFFPFLSHLEAVEEKGSRKRTGRKKKKNRKTKPKNKSRKNRCPSLELPMSFPMLISPTFIYLNEPECQAIYSPPWESCEMSKDLRTDPFICWR